MTILPMSQKEIDRLDVVSQVADKRLTLVRAGRLLGLSKRQMQRLVNQYRQSGAVGLLSKRRDQPSNRRYPDSLENMSLR